MRESMRLAREARLSGGAWRVLSVILEQTGTYSRLEDRIYAKKLADGAGIPLKKVWPYVKQLEAAGCIHRERSPGHHASLYSLPSPRSAVTEQTVPGPGEDRASQATPGTSTKTLPPAGDSSEEWSREDAGGEEAHAFQSLLAQVKGAPQRGPQRDEWRKAFEEEPEGFARVVSEAVRHGKRPAALLTTKVRAGEHVSPLDGALYVLEIHSQDRDEPIILDGLDVETARRRKREFEAEGYDVVSYRQEGT
jgi:hypothetical protein